MVIVSIFGFLVSVILLCSIVFYFYLAYSSKKWNGVDAIVDKVGITKVGEEPLKYNVFINYHYFIKGKKYDSERIGFFPKVIFLDKKQAEKFLNSFFYNENSIKIYVHPYLSKFSVILVGIHNKMVFIFGALMTFICMICFGYIFFYYYN